jgi:hypothetical protein
VRPATPPMPFGDMVSEELPVRPVFRLDYSQTVKKAWHGVDSISVLILTPPQILLSP